MRLYKFRGKRLDNKELIYGDLSTSNRPAIGDGKNWFLVDPESVAQFVGYDYDGNEVYEGDELVQATNIYIRFKAGLNEATIERGIWSTDFAAQVKSRMLVLSSKLKERKASLWRGKKLYPRQDDKGDDLYATGELQIRSNEFIPDRYTCYICDRLGLQEVDMASLERVESQ